MAFTQARQQLSLRSLRKHSRVVSLPGTDVRVMAELPVSQHSLSFLPAVLKDREWFRKIASVDLLKTIEVSMDEESYPIPVGQWCLDTLKDEYVRRRDRGVSPSWFQDLPRYVRQHIGYEYLVHGGDPLVIVPTMPYSGIRYVIQQGGMVQATLHAFPLGRLGEIAQLGYLRNPLSRLDGFESTVTLEFRHTRLLHSYDVYVLARLMAARLELGKVEANTLAFAALTHDILTPAGGDTAKVVDPAGLDEDANYSNMLREAGAEWEKLRERFRIDEELLIRTIKGEGLLGQLLDLADKCSYISRDTDAFVGQVQTFQEDGPIVRASPRRYNRILDILRSEPDICALWETVRIINGKLVIDDPDRLGDFLLLRGLMTKLLYYNAYSRFLEDGVMKAVFCCLHEQGKLSVEWLLGHNDADLRHHIDQETGVQMLEVEIERKSHPLVEEFETETLARERLAELLKEDPDLFVHMDMSRATSSAAINRFPVLAGTKLLSLPEARPFMALDIENVLRSRRPYRVYAYRFSELGFSADFAKSLRAFQERRFIGP